MYFGERLRDERGDCLQLEIFRKQESRFELLNNYVKKSFALNHSCGEKEGDRLSILIRPINWLYSSHTSGSKVLTLCAPKLLAEK
jgi:hypothetical protein